MKIGFEIGGGIVASWRADASDIPGFRRLEMLRRSTRMPEMVDDGTALCRVVKDVDMAKSIPLSSHVMRIEFADDLGSSLCAFRDPSLYSKYPENMLWRGVRKMLFAGLVPCMLRHECFMMHGALMERNGKAVVLSGPSGIGKSTTARRMSEHFRILADDCLLLYRDGEGWAARPLPTWSVYLFSKTELVPCDISSVYPVSHLLILGRGEDKYTPLAPETALVGMATAFTDMVQWHLSNFPDELCRKLRDAALDAAAAVVRGIPCGALQLTLDSDVFRVLPEEVAPGVDV